MFPQTQQATPIPSYGYASTPFDEDYNPKKYVTPGSTNPFEQPEKPKNTSITHVVKDGDSLISLSLTYGVAAPLIRKANGLTSDEIYYLHELKIPNPRNVVYPDPPDYERDLKQTQATVRQAFKNRTGEHDPKIIEKYMNLTAYNFYDSVDRYEKDKYEIRKRKESILALRVQLKKDDRDDKIAEFYLDSNNWDIKKALDAYNEDLQAERGHVQGGQPGPQGTHNYQQVPQYGGFVPPGHFGMTYNTQQGNSYQVNSNEYNQRFIYRGQQ